MEPIQVQCPYCGEWVEVYLDPMSRGTMVQDCEVCCNPWQLTVRRRSHSDEGFGGEGEPAVEVERLQ